ncbi:MAG: EMC3/TMCO1 family protein [archaeon]
MEAAIVVLLITIALAAITKVLQRKLIDKKKMQELQKQIKDDQKKFNELLKEAEKNKKEIEELQTQILKENTEMLNMNMKLSMFTMPAFLVAFWFLGTLYTGKILESIIPLPTFHNFNLFNPLSWVPVGISVSTGYYKMYFFYYFVSAILMGLIEKLYDIVKQKMKK